MTKPDSLCVYCTHFGHYVADTESFSGMMSLSRKHGILTTSDLSCFRKYRIIFLKM